MDTQTGPLMVCPVCEGAGWDWKRAAEDDRYFSVQDVVDVYHCERCDGRKRVILYPPPIAGTGVEFDRYTVVNGWGIPVMTLLNPIVENDEDLGPIWPTVNPALVARQQALDPDFILNNQFMSLYQKEDALVNWMNQKLAETTPVLVDERPVVYGRLSEMHEQAYDRANRDLFRNEVDYTETYEFSNVYNSVRTEGTRPIILGPGEKIEGDKTGMTILGVSETGAPQIWGDFGKMMPETLEWLETFKKSNIFWGRFKRLLWRPYFWWTNREERSYDLYGCKCDRCSED